jgi:fluoride ion exporter CrcB/FEX
VRQDAEVQYVAIAVGAMLGANARFVVGNWAAERWGVDDLTIVKHTLRRT